MVYAAERIQELINHPEITDPEVRRLPSAMPKVGIGVVEAPRGTLFHHYVTDEAGIIKEANLIVATGNNAARIAMSVEKAAKGLIKNGTISEGLLNRVEMAFRAYDPCLGCATHTLPGRVSIQIRIHDSKHQTMKLLEMT
jgi:F420-non-reducing hydrogenase large subunit